MKHCYVLKAFTQYTLEEEAKSRKALFAMVASMETGE